jgi:competence ComEA-like helix-hairpin-helix protein
MFVKDSVFSKYLKFDNDKLPLGEKQTLLDLDKLQSKSQISLNNILYNAARKLLAKVDKAISDKDYTPLIKGEWGVIPELERALWATWNAGWSLGGEHGDKEIDLQKAEFSRKREAKTRSIRNTPAERAIRRRTNRLAKDISRTEFKRIKQHLLAAVTPQKDTGQPISRTELLKRIESELGSKTGRFRNRASTIARTELTFAYNAGRLQTYRESGSVEAVKFYTIVDERRCPICASRQGLVLPLSNWVLVAANTPPAHPNCRCVWTPVLKEQKKILNDPKRAVGAFDIVPRPAGWASAAILAAVLLAGGKSGTLTAVPAAVATTEIAKILSEPSIEKVEREEVVTAIPASRPKLMVGSVDLNRATIQELTSLLPGRSLNVRQARSIIRYRNQTPFQSIDDLRKVPEIGQKTVEKLRQLAEGSEIFVFLSPQNIRTPTQLWASNLGLTRSQAKIVFDEMQKGAFKDLQDLQTRLKGKGIGKKTIENMRKRAVIIQESMGQTSKRYRPTPQQLRLPPVDDQAGFSRQLKKVGRVRDRLVKKMLLRKSRR